MEIEIREEWLVDFGQLIDWKVNSWPKVNSGKNMLLLRTNEGGPQMTMQWIDELGQCELIVQMDHAQTKALTKMNAHYDWMRIGMNNLMFLNQMKHVMLMNQTIWTFVMSLPQLNQWPPIKQHIKNMWSLGWTPNLECTYIQMDDNTTIII